jgi:pyruvate dehydrogenase E1 component
VEEVLGKTAGPIIASSDYQRMLPEQIAPYVNGRLLALGADGFGRSETRKSLRRFFEIDAESVTIAALHALAERGEMDRDVVQRAIVELGVDPDGPHPWTV